MQKPAAPGLSGNNFENFEMTSNKSSIMQQSDLLSSSKNAVEVRSTPVSIKAKLNYGGGQQQSNTTQASSSKVVN